MKLHSWLTAVVEQSMRDRRDRRQGAAMASIGYTGPTACTVVKYLQFIKSIKFKDRSGQHDISTALTKGITKI